MSAAGVPADPHWPADALEVGRILDAWGIRGWLRIQPFAAEPEALLSARYWLLKPPESSGPARALVPTARFPESLTIAEVKLHGDGIVARAEGVADRSAAEGLRGARIFIPRSSFPAAAADEYYWADLIGLAVSNRQGELLGRVVGLLDTGPHSVLRIRPESSCEADGADERLIPFVAAYVDDVDLGRRLITVDWGLDF